MNYSTPSPSPVPQTIRLVMDHVENIDQDGVHNSSPGKRKRESRLFDAEEVNQAAAIVKQRIVHNQNWEPSTHHNLINTVDLYVKLANEKQGAPWKSSLSFREELERRISLKATRISGKPLESQLARLSAWVGHENSTVSTMQSQKPSLPPLHFQQHPPPKGKAAAVPSEDQGGRQLSHKEVEHAVKSVRAFVLKEFPYPDIQEDMKKTMTVYSKLAHEKLCAPWKSSLPFQEELARRLCLKANRLENDLKTNRPPQDVVDCAVVAAETRIQSAFLNPVVQQKAIRTIRHYANMTKERGHAPWKVRSRTFEDELYHRACNEIRPSSNHYEHDSSPVAKKRKISNTDEIDRAASVVEAKIRNEFISDPRLQYKAIKIMRGYVQQTKAIGRAPWRAAASSKSFEDELYRRVYMKALNKVNASSNGVNDGQQAAFLTGDLDNEGELDEEPSLPEMWQIVQSEADQGVEFEWPIVTPIYSCEV